MQESYNKRLSINFSVKERLSKGAILCKKRYRRHIYFTQKNLFCSTQGTIIYHKCVLYKMPSVHLCRLLK